jgi:hypothetical protein
VDSRATERASAWRRGIGNLEGFRVDSIRSVHVPGARTGVNPGVEALRFE